MSINVDKLIILVLDYQLIGVKRSRLPLIARFDRLNQKNKTAKPEVRNHKARGPLPTNHTKLQ